MEISIEKAALSEKSVLRNLMELCQHDYSEFNRQDLDQHGLYGYTYLDNYWTERGRYPYLIKVSGKLAGFALVRVLSGEGEPLVYSMAEFFILRKYRRKGIGEQVATQVFDMFPGEWRVSQQAANFPAQAFWRKVISRYTRGNFVEVPEGPIQQFKSPPKIREAK